MQTILDTTNISATRERFESYRRRELAIIKHKRAHTPLRKRWISVTLGDVLEKFWPSCAYRISVWLGEDEGGDV